MYVNCTVVHWHSVSHWVVAVAVVVDARTVVKRKHEECCRARRQFVLENALARRPLKRSNKESHGTIWQEARALKKTTKTTTNTITTNACETKTSAVLQEFHDNLNVY